MYKTMIVVALFAFVLQGTFSSPSVDNKPADVKQNAESVPEAKNQVENKPDNQNVASKTQYNEDTPSTTQTPTTTTPKSGASSTETCILLVQISSLALVAKHMLL